MPETEYLSIEQAASLFPPFRQGKPTHRHTVKRWIIDGTKTPSGVVRLKASKFGRRWLTTRQWVEEYTAALTAAFSDADGAPVKMVGPGGHGRAMASRTTKPSDEGEA
jgi:hypothetical protein